MLKAFGAVLAAMLATVALLTLPFFAGGYALLYKSVFGTANANVDTQIVRQSNQYVTTQQQSLVQKMEDWRRVDAEAGKAADPAPLRAQQSAIVSSMKVTAATLSPDQIPADVRAFMAGR